MRFEIFILSFIVLCAFTYVKGQMVTLDSNKAELTGFVVCSSGDSLLRDEAVTPDQQLYSSIRNEKIDINTDRTILGFRFS